MRGRFSGVKGSVLAGIMLMSLLAMFPMNVEAGPTTVVTLLLNEAGLDVVVSPGSPGTETFTGKVTVETNDALSPVTFSLNAAVQGGSAIVSPSSYTQKGSGEIPINVMIQMPVGTPFRAYSLTISGSWTQPGSSGGALSAQGQVIVLQYYKTMIESEMPYVEVSPSDLVLFSIKIHNLGNAEDTFRVDIENLDELSEAGWTLPSLPLITIEEKGVKVITLSATTPQDWTAWRNEVDMIKLKVTSETSERAGMKFSLAYPLYVRQKGLHIPGFEPMLALFALAFVAVIMRKRL